MPLSAGRAGDWLRFAPITEDSRSIRSLDSFAQMSPPFFVVARELMKERESRSDFLERNLQIDQYEKKQTKQQITQRHRERYQG